MTLDEWKLDDWKKVASIVQGLSASIALLAAGWWASRNARIEGKYDESLLVTLFVKVLESQTLSMRILEVRINLKNVGKVPCQIELSRSTVTISRINVSSAEPHLSWQADPYFSGRLEDDSRVLLNIPVGASAVRVTFAAVPHPGIYGVRTLLALAEAGSKRYYRRLNEPFPADWQKHENAVYWDDAAIVTSDSGHHDTGPHQSRPTNGDDLSTA